MAYNKPNLRGGIVPFLEATTDQNNGLTVDRFVQVMTYSIPELNKLTIIRDESGRSLNTIKRWVAQYKLDIHE